MKILLLIVFTILGSSNTICLFAQCGEMRKNPTFPTRLGDHSVEGTSVLFPEIKLKVTSRDTGEILPLQEMYLFYIWEHFLVSSEYNMTGEWTESSDAIVCTTNGDGIVHFPEYNFVPRGWYDGPKLGKKLPKFLEVVAAVKNYHFLIKKDQLKKIRDNKIKEPIVLKSPSGNERPIKVEIIP